MGSGGSRTSPEGLPKYVGQPTKYTFINVKRDMSIEVFSNLVPPTMSITNHPARPDYITFQKMYTRGFKMVSTFSMAYNVDADKSSKQTIAQCFLQGIFIPITDTKGEDLSMQTCSVKNESYCHYRNPQKQGLKFGVKSNIQEIYENIQSIASSGGKLVTVEMMELSAGGFEAASITLAFAGRKQERASLEPTEQLYRRMMPITMVPAKLSVDIFFEIASGKSSSKYTYEYVNIPMMTNYERIGPTTSIQWDNEKTRKYFEKGWKLVDVFVDPSSDVSITRSSTIVRNTVWIFEKSSSENKSGFEQGYEIIMRDIKFNITLKLKGCCNTGVNVTLEGHPWEEDLIKYGVEGWEVVRIIPTPDFRVYSGLSRKFRMTLIAILQRKRTGHY